MSQIAFSTFNFNIFLFILSLAPPQKILISVLCINLLKNTKSFWVCVKMKDGSGDVS